MLDRAYAKINLSLDVSGVREDGYHELKSIMLPITFYDELRIDIADEDHYSCNRDYLRFDQNNSILKMLTLLKERYEICDHHKIQLNKYIPMQAGLGGGTSDAAAALRIFQKLYHLSMSDEEIREICVRVGADVFFNYHNIPAVVSGIGDQIEAISIRKPYYIFLVKPRSGVSTKEAYQLLDMKKCDHPDIDALKKALTDGDDIHGLLGNSLEQSALQLNKEIAAIKEKLIEKGARNVLMSGSGSTVFCIDENKEEIEKISRSFRMKGCFVRFAQVLSEKEYNKSRI